MITNVEGLKINKTKLEDGYFLDVQVPKTVGICAKEICIEVDKNKIIKDLCVNGGCAGNLSAVANLIRGEHIKYAIDKLDGIICGRKETSCPNEIANILKTFDRDINE